MKTRVVSFLIVMCLIIIPTVAQAQEAPEKTDEELLIWATSLMHRAVVIDGHSDSLSRMVRGFDFTKRQDGDGHMDVPRLVESGMNGQFLAAFLFPGRENGIQRVLDMIDAGHRLAEKDDRFVLAYTAEDILEAKRNGKVAGILCIEGGHAIEDDLAVLRMYYKLGVRYMTLTWMNSNNWADASGPDQSRYGNLGPHGGLTDFGKEVIREMNRLGMIVDISHVHDDTFWDVIEITSKPVIASHSCAYGVNPHFRNLKDDMLKALAENGGVIGINFAPSFLSARYDEVNGPIREKMYARYRELQKTLDENSDEFKAEVAKLRAEMKETAWRVPLSVLVDHIEHVVEVAGVDHVGLGSDFDGIGDTPEKIEDCTDLVYIVVELRKRGWSEEDIRKVLGENFLRVIRENTGA
jgi:membrane dipeptidase